METYQLIRRDIWFTCVFSLIITYLWSAVPFARDATDPPSGKRSGMALLIDHETGLHYLSNGSTLIPRLAPDGSHMGNKN